MCKKITKDKTTNIKTHIHTYTPQTGNNLNVHQEGTGSLYHVPFRQWNITQPLRLKPHLLIDKDAYDTLHLKKVECSTICII